MTMQQFAKLNGLGNDFIFFDGLDGSFEIEADQVRALCDRHFGIGADGVIVVRPSRVDGADAFMDYWNSDGTLAQMCGNGVRCFAKYLVDRQIVDASEHSLSVDTRAGIKQITYSLDENGLMEKATVDMGAPELEPARVPTTLSANATTSFGASFVNDVSISSPYGTFAFTCVSMGNPHAVCFIKEWESLPDELFVATPKSLATFDVAKVGSFFECCVAFPEKANIEFATINDEGISMRVFERGCGETLACGTGACATGVAACLTGRCGCENDIHLLGGTLHIAYEPGAHVFMTGPAAERFTGNVEL